MLQREIHLKKDTGVTNKILNIKVLMYHRVIDTLPQKYSHWHYVTISEFRKQMELIDKLDFTPITFFDYQLYLEGKLTLPAKPIIITFDDGYMDTYLNAIPILLEMNMNAVIFVMGNRKLKRALWDEQDEEDVCPLMTDEQLLEANSNGFEIGAHSLNHQPLVGLPDNEVYYEIKRSKEQIESILNEPIYTFSYPYGNVNNRLKKIVSESGFSFACGVYSGSPKFGETLFDVRRLAVNHHTTITNFALKLLLPYQYLEWLYNRLKNRNEEPEIKKEGMKGKLEERKNGKKKSSSRYSKIMSDTKFLH